MKTSLCGYFRPSLLLVPVFVCFAGCGSQQAADQAAGSFSGTIRIDGSSTVFPISAVASEMVAEVHPGINVVVKQSGTSSGMGKFLLGEVDICDASRKITDEEIEQAQAQGITPLQFTVALDGITVCVNPDNNWVDTMTVDQLKAIWQPEATGEVMQWNQVNPDWPAEDFKLYGPGTASGTFEYFTKVVNGKKKASRSDYTASENDNTLVKGVAGDKGSLGYFGLAYYLENPEKLKLIAIDGGNGPVKASDQSVKDGTYVPLSRPLYIYVNHQLLDRPEGKAFVEFYLERASEMAVKAKYVAAPESVHTANAALLAQTLEKQTLENQTSEQ